MAVEQGTTYTPGIADLTPLPLSQKPEIEPATPKAGGITPELREKIFREIELQSVLGIIRQTTSNGASPSEIIEKAIQKAKNLHSPVRDSDNFVVIGIQSVKTEDKPKKFLYVLSTHPTKDEATKVVGKRAYENLRLYGYQSDGWLNEEDASRFYVVDLQQLRNPREDFKPPVPPPPSPEYLSFLEKQRKEWDERWMRWDEEKFQGPLEQGVLFEELLQK